MYYFLYSGRIVIPPICYRQLSVGDVVECTVKYCGRHISRIRNGGDVMKYIYIYSESEVSHLRTFSGAWSVLAMSSVV